MIRTATFRRISDCESTRRIGPPGRPAHHPGLPHVHSLGGHERFGAMDASWGHRWGRPRRVRSARCGRLDLRVSGDGSSRFSGRLPRRSARTCSWASEGRPCSGRPASGRPMPSGRGSSRGRPCPARPAGRGLPRTRLPRGGRAHSRCPCKTVPGPHGGGCPAVGRRLESAPHPGRSCCAWPFPRRAWLQPW